MKLSIRAITTGFLVLLGLGKVLAVPFQPTFSDYVFPGSQYTVDTAANDFFSLHYGITIDNAYLYKDSRDTFDGIGISVGTVPEIGSIQTGVIKFLDSTNFVSLDYWTILGTTYSVVDASGKVLDSVSYGDNKLGTYNFSSTTRIAALVWTANGGYGQVTGLRYDYDGKTDGHNDDLDHSVSNRVPDTANTALVLSTSLGLLLLAFRRRV